MNLCIKIPTRLKFKRFNKKYAKLKYVVDHRLSNISIQDSPQFVCGLKALGHGFMTSKLLNSSILFLRRAVGKGRVGWPRVRITFNLKVPVTKKSEGHRMGKGKGPVRFWGVPVKAGSFVFKIHKSPRKMFAFQTFDWTHIFSFFELFSTISSVYDTRYDLHTNYRSSAIINNIFLFKLTFKFKLLFFSFFYKLKLDFLSFFGSLKNFFHTNKESTLPLFLFQMNKLFSLKTKNNFNNNLFFFRVFLSFFFLKLYFRTFVKHNNKFYKEQPNSQILELLTSKVSSKLVRSFYSFFFLKGRRFFISNKRSQFCAVNNNGGLQNVCYMDSTLLAERTQRLSETKISYLPSLFRGLRRIKKKMPFPCEFFFVDTRNCGYSFYKSIKDKRSILKQCKQR